ncbi:OefC protein [Uncinocarpus reesii 1704]|uniref:OefC protein n=1 Tax=Uncinocarpus reesii (strain UAMH 1704) TaxID=336963 RepID=C4JWB4_UNCRE|nr:OefC protein [Uncinocarpus reesii 1704]EEP81991.1 OefC protein [Uncinocarpus reesii 1704]
MLFTQRASTFSTHQLPLNPGRTILSHNVTNPPESDRDPADSKRLDLTASPSPVLESPPSSCTSERFSRLAITTSGDDGPGKVDSRLSEPAPNLVRTEEHRRELRKSFSTHSYLGTPTSPTLTFGFQMISSSDTDDVVPKVEEIDDEEAFAIESGVGQSSTQVHVDTVDAKDTWSPTLVNGPKKRGRPRKHPLPVPGQAKVTKGRSKTGCITCRRRKKKCDETKPSCLNCQKNSVVCEGYPAKEIWKSGKQKLEEAARRNSMAFISRGLPILIDGIETEVDRRFLDHFVYDFSRVLTLVNDDSNPFKEILLPMATQHTGLMHSLMCLAGSHLSSRNPEPRFKERKHYHFDRAITDLRNTIAARSSGNGEESEFLIEDPMIASTIALCLNTICEGETKGEYRSHMDAARFLLVTQRPKNEKFRQFIVEFFQYHDVSSALTTLDRRPICLTGDLRLPDFVPHAQAGALLGIFDGLFLYISEITVIRDKIRQRINEGLDPAVDYQTLSEAVAIDSRIRAWEPSYPPEHQNWYAAQLYRQSTWVYLYRTIRPSHPNEKISQVVDDGLLFLDQLPLDAGAYSILLMPLFLLGCSAFETHQRERIRRGFESLQAYSSLRNIEPALRIVERVWDVMDTAPNKSWDWEKIIDDMEMDFLIT